VKAEITYTFAESVVSISEENAAEIIGVSDDAKTVTLDANSPLAEAVDIGSVMVFGITPETPHGLLRRVVDKEADGGMLSLTTEQATLEEAFQDLDLKFSAPIVPEVLETYRTDLEGLEIRRSPLEGSGSGQKSFSKPFDAVVYDADGSLATTSDQVTVSGTVDITLTLDFYARVEWFKPKEVRVELVAHEVGNLVVSSSLPSLSLEESVSISGPYFPPIPVGPITIVPSLELILGVVGELDAQAELEVSQELTVSAGVEWTPGKWKPFSSVDSEFGFGEPKIEANAVVKAYAGPRVTLEICDVAGPYGQVNGYLEFMADLVDEPWWSLYGGIEGWIGVSGKVFGVSLPDYHSDDLIGYKKLLAQADTSCQPDCGGKDCGSDGCGGNCGNCGAVEQCKNGKCADKPGDCKPEKDHVDCNGDKAVAWFDACGDFTEEVETCVNGWKCVDAECVKNECEPDCGGKECGIDGCGGSCGSCPGDQTCQSGQCSGGSPADCGSVELCDTGDVALDGSNPSAGDNLTSGGWSKNGGSKELTEYSDAAAKSGTLSMRTHGYNGAGVQYSFPGLGGGFTAQVWYRTTTEDSVDHFRVGADDGETWLQINTRDQIFKYFYKDANQSTGEQTLPDSPPLQAGQWYCLTIDVGPAGVILTVEGAGSTTEFTVNPVGIAYEQVRFGVDYLGGHDHTAYWDDFWLDW